MSFITLSGRRWNTHGSSKEGSGKEAGSEKASQKGGTKEEIISSYYTKTFFCDFFTSPFRITDTGMIPYHHTDPGNVLHSSGAIIFAVIRIQPANKISTDTLRIRGGEPVNFSCYRRDPGMVF
jgi:hypothetical protein